MYIVKKRYAKGPDSIVGQYKKQEEAVVEIQKKLAEDAAMKIPSTSYALYEFGELIKEYTQADLKPEAKSSSEESSGKGQGQRFSPSPLNTAPRPSGMPHSSWKDDEKAKK